MMAASQEERYLKVILLPVVMAIRLFKNDY